MRPVLFEVFGLPIHSYGVSKAAAALVAGYLLAREFRRLGWNPDRAWSIVIAATVMGFVGGKLYYPAEHAGSLSPHSFGPSGFTWYGGLIAGVLTVVVLARRYEVPLGPLAGIAAAPLSLAHGIGRSLWPVPTSAWSMPRGRPSGRPQAAPPARWRRCIGR